MKNSFCLVMLVLLAGLNSPAQAQTTTKMTSKTSSTKTTTVKTPPAPPMHDCCMMKDGKMMQMKHSKLLPMTGDVTMSDGSICMTDGTCKHKDGTTTKMKDGDCMMMDGKMMMSSGTKKPHPMKADHQMDGAKK